MKYFLVGALASTFLLYGVATLYGRFGTTSLNRLAAVAGRVALLLGLEQRGCVRIGVRK